MSTKKGTLNGDWQQARRNGAVFDHFAAPANPMGRYTEAG